MNWDGIMWNESVKLIEHLPKFPDPGTACMVESLGCALVFTGKKDGWVPMLDSNTRYKTYSMEDSLALEQENKLYKSEIFRLLYA